MHCIMVYSLFCIADKQLSRTEKALVGQAAVIVAHTAIGPHDEFILRTLTELAQEGYIAFALDMFGAPDVVTGEAKEAANAPYKNQRSLIATHASAAVRLVQDMEDVDAKRVAAIGYCFGGKVVLDLARTGADLKAVVSFHGVLDSLGKYFGDYDSEKGPSIQVGVDGEEGEIQVGVNSRVKPRILVFHGYADPFTPPDNLQEFVNELEEMHAQYEVRLHGSHVLHAFTRREKTQPEDKAMGLQYSERVAKAAWATTLDFLADSLA